MAKIEKVSIWKDGKNYQVDDLGLVIVSDDLSSQATFYYKLSVASVMGLDEEGRSVVHSPGTTIADGNVTISGEDYQNWGLSGDANKEAFEFVASQLGLVLVNE